MKQQFEIEQLQLEKESLRKFRQLVSRMFDSTDQDVIFPVDCYGNSFLQSMDLDEDEMAYVKKFRQSK
jgi:hypothetical protein